MPRARFIAVAAAIACAVGLASGAPARAGDPPMIFDTDLITAHMAPIVFPTEPPQLSNDCRTLKVAGDQFRRPLRGLRRAIREHRDPRVLAIGSSSTVGVGASRPQNAYIAKLESTLEGAFRGVDFAVIGKGMSGEVAEGQSARMKDTVAEVKPDLVLWQVGTNDAIRHVDLNGFKDCLRRTLAWLRDNNFDVVLVDPQYSAELAKDAFYWETVAAVADVAREMRVLLVDRFDAMRELSAKRGDGFYITSDNLHLNDNGHRCMGEQLARSIAAGVLQADFEAAVPTR